MATIEATFVQGNTAPDIVGQLHEEGSPSKLINLATCSVRFQMRKPDDRMFTVDAPAEITDAANGGVSYSWSTHDLDVEGEYDAQWEVTYLGGRKQTVVKANRILVRRK